MTSSRPYLIRAIYDWITDNQMTPHAVVDASLPNVQVPEKYVVEGKIILNVSANATQKLIITNDALEFDARFGNDIWHIYAPASAVIAVYAKENGRGMIFEENDIEQPDGGGDGGSDTTTSSETKPIKPGRPNLKIVK